MTIAAGMTSNKDKANSKAPAVRSSKFGITRKRILIRRVKSQCGCEDAVNKLRSGGLWWRVAGAKIGPLKALLAVVLASFPLAAQVVKTLELNSTRGRQAYYLVFAARGGSSTGHAFVVWGVEDDARKMSSIEALGLYPESDGANCGHFGSHRFRASEG